MLNYIITIAISAFFVPHYLSIFWEPLKTNPWDIIGGTVVIVFLAVVDFATQLIERGIARGGSRASSARFETVSMPV